MNNKEGHSLWSHALYKFSKDRLGMLALFIVVLYFLISIGVWCEIIGVGWDEMITDGYTSISKEHWLGTNMNGQDIFKRIIFGTKTAFEVGLSVAIIATILGGVLGAIAGFYHNTFIDHVIAWFYGCLDSIPFYLFVAAVSFALEDFYYSMHIAMIATLWSGTCRVIRGEVIKIKSHEYVEAARAISVPEYKIIFKHILPNTIHLLLVEGTITFVTAIKAEAVLSFLGIGVKEGTSWGLILSESATEIDTGFLNNFLGASLFLFVMVMAFNIFSDSLQDALDPKKVG